LAAAASWCLVLPAAAAAAGAEAQVYPPLSPSQNGRPVAAVHYLAAGEEIRLAAQVLAPGATLEAVRIDNITGRSALWRSDGEGEAGPLTVAAKGRTLADGRGKMNFGPLGEAEEMLALTLADTEGAFKDGKADFRVTFFMAGGARAMCLLKAADQPASAPALASTKEAASAPAQASEAAPAAPASTKEAASAPAAQAAQAAPAAPAAPAAAMTTAVAVAVGVEASRWVIPLRLPTHRCIRWTLMVRHLKSACLLARFLT